MKKIVKKLMVTGLMICTLLLAPAIMSYAAEGTISFSDPTGKVGEDILVKVKMEGGGAPIGDGQATISYDSTKLEFVSGTNATGGNGTVELSASGTGTETELAFELTFKALAEGSTNIEVVSTTAYLFSDETLNLAPGSAAVTIEAGDGTTTETPDSETTETESSGERKISEANVEVLGTMYGIYENFTDALIPEGFSKTTINYNGEEHSAIMQDVSGEVLVYLVVGENDPVMAVYDEEKSSFVVAEQVSTGADSYIFVLSEGDGSTLPEQYQDAVMEINGTNFPAWQNMNAKDYYLVYALSSEGNKGYYEYDSTEGTYQRFALETPAEEAEEENAVIAKAKELVDQYFMILVVAGAAFLLLLVIFIIVLSVKLHCRNKELDRFYDDYDEESDEDEEYDEEYDDFEDEYEADEDEDDDYDDYDDDYEDDDDYNEYDEDYDDYDDDDDEEEDNRKQKYDVDFIDL